MSFLSVLLETKIFLRACCKIRSGKAASREETCNRRASKRKESSHGGSLTIAAEEGPGPHRPARRQPRADAPPNACNEPGKAGCRTRPHLPAGAEIRERRQPHRGEPVAANLPYPAGASGVLLRGRAERISATRLQWKRVIDGPD